MPALGSRDEAIVALCSHALWEEYKAALLRRDKARARFEAAPEQDTALREEAARRFRKASLACEAVQKRIMNLRRRTWI